MLLKRWFLMYALLFISFSATGLSGYSYAAEHSRDRSGRPSDAIKGTWHSPTETLTFNSNGTVVYKGKRYYYAVSSGGTIQLTAKSGSLTIPYHIASGKLTLTVDGKSTVYTRKRRVREKKRNDGEILN